MIKTMEVEDIAKILSLDDPHLNHVGCEKGQWVQWMIQNVDNPDFFMMCCLEEDALTGYIVAINAISPPISSCVSVLYATGAGREVNKAVLEMLVSWAREKGAKSIDFITNNVAAHKAYGFMPVATLMSMEL